MLGRKLLEDGHHVSGGGGLGIADVDGLLDAARLLVDGAADAGKRVKEVVGCVDAHARAIRGGVQLGKQLEVVALGALDEVGTQEIVHQHADGIARTFGKRGVAALAMRGDAGKCGASHGGLCATGQVSCRAGSNLDALYLGQRRGIGKNPSLCQARDGVGHRAALERDEQAALERGRGKRAAAVAFLAHAGREARVRRKEESGAFVHRQVVVDVGHADFLVAAEDEAQAIGQRLAALDEIVGHVSGEDGRTLVVDHAAPKEIALALGHREGVLGPTHAGRHHVDVRDGGDLRGALAGQVGIADVAVHVVRLQAQALRHVERAGEGTLGLGPIGGTLLGLVGLGHAGNGHKRRQVLDHSGPHALDVCLDIGDELGIVHGEAPLSHKVLRGHGSKTTPEGP